MSKKYFKIIGGVLAIIVIIGVFFYYYSNSTQEGVSAISSSSSVVNLNGEVTGVGKDLLVMLKTIKSIDINNDFFIDDIFTGFIDYSQELPKDEKGRSNPFSPIKID